MFFCTAVLAQATPLTRLPVPDPDRWHVQGTGEMRWFGFSLYTARLWRSGERWQENKPYALELTYRHNISAQQLVSASIDEMRRLESRDETLLARWREQLTAVFPSVAEGDSLLGVHEPGRGASFYFNGSFRGRIDDPVLAAAFFAIWLDARTREPALRAKLLAEGTR